MKNDDGNHQKEIVLHQHEERDVKKHHKVDDEGIDLEKVKQDAANDAVAMTLLFAMGLFVVLFATAMGLALLVVQQYGFVAAVAVLTLMGIMVGLSVVIYRAVTEEKQLRKAHKNIVCWKEVAKQMVVNEINAFHDEMNDHLRLTDGGEYSNEDLNNKETDHGRGTTYVAMTDFDDRNPSDTFIHTDDDDMRQLPISGSSQTKESQGSRNKDGKRKKRKSVLFAVAKPFLSLSRSSEGNIGASSNHSSVANNYTQQGKRKGPRDGRRAKQFS